MNHENNDNSHNQASFSDRNRRPLLPLNPNGSSVTPTTHSSSCSSSPVQDVNIPDTSVGHLNTRNQTENFSATPNAFLQNLIESTHENLNSSNMIVSPGSNGFNNGCRECTDESCYSCRQFPSMSSGYRGDWGMYHPLLVPQTTVSSAFLKPNCGVGNFKWEITHAMNEARYGIAIMREDLDAVQIATNILDQRAKQAATDTMLCIRGLINDLKERERNLMHKVERARLTKYSALRAREEGLREGISKLVNTLDRLHVIRNAQENSPADARFVKDFMMSEMFQMRQIQANLPSLEENWITFNAPDPGVNMAIANIGSLTILNPGHVGDRRGNRGRSICSPPVVIPPTLSLTVMASPPLAKAISSCDYPVICWLSKQTSSENLQPVRMIGTANIDIRDNICRPWGVACDKDGYLIIADRSNNRIQIYLWNGRFIRRFGTHGTGPGQFDRPAGVTVDAYQRIIVADKDNHRIQIFSMDGIFISTFGEKGALNGQFNYPWDVATNNKCQIVVSDTRNHRIQLFSPEGSFVSKYGFESNPSSWKYFDSPRGVSFCPDGSIIMTDFNNHRVIVVDSELLNARVICENATGTRLFSRPQGVIVDDEGNIIVADSRNHRIQIFDSLGRYKCKFGIYGKCYGELDRPSGIALLPDGRLAVVDFGNNRLIIL